MPPRSAFIHTLWMHPSIPRSMTKIRRDLENAARRELRPPAVAYVFGAEALGLVRSLGFAAVLADGRALAWEEKHMWRHKIAAWQAALAEYDEVVFTDWDVPLLKPLPGDFWDRLRTGPVLQAAMLKRRSPHIRWRRMGHGRCITPSACWVYLRGRAVADELARIHDAHLNDPGKAWSEEWAMARWTDDRMGRWRGPSGYWHAGFEPYCFRFSDRHSPLPPDLRDLKIPYFGMFVPSRPEGEVLRAFAERDAKLKR